MNRRALFSLAATALVLGGCSKLKRLTGQRNDTVLPGQREEILPPDQYTAKSEDLNAPGADADAGAGADVPATPGPTPQTGEACNPDVDPDCGEPPSSGANKGIFNDG
jgi:hypothetical protein